MSDHITLPREDIISEADAWLKMNGLASDRQTCFRMALFAQHISALAAPPPEPDCRHPGYVIGNHWFETAYDRLCAGETEDDILADYGIVREERLAELRRDAERYRYLRNRDLREVFSKSGEAAGVWIDCEDDMAGLQLLTGDDADAAIDAAMQKGDKT